ncbi:hypothetical protein OV079_23925 [Nannocystis pusilla]|uniref:Uncharacterized protein n=1 Tax=Nannocystis pusilla TaxID=889268 RepID=A0A9X3EQS1_9BACT|nr:hypothetical protein [Nannocystis pusilla]MCY1008552.1 hypothetical protein [Nannocystis pusilla]
MARSKKDSGRKRERYGFQIVTSELGPSNWLVHVFSKRPGDGVERDLFAFEGEAIDWAEDWCHEHRSITHKVKSTEDGAVAIILDHGGHEIQRLSPQPAPHAADLVAGQYIEALRRHDLVLIAERRKNRANFRMEMMELDEREEFLQGQIQTAKDAIKKIDDKRTDLKRGLSSPQVEFNFVASTAHDDLEQLDVEDYAKKRRSPRGALAAVKGGVEQTEASTT